MKLLEDLYEQKEKKLFISFHHSREIVIFWNDGFGGKKQ